MSKDVSITDLIAAARNAAKIADYYQTGEADLFIMLADALEASERDAQQAEDQANNLAGDVVQLEQELAALESVTVPTENPSVSDLGEVIWRTSRADESTISVTGANIVAKAILARFRLPVPVEPEWEYFIERPMFAEDKWNEGLYASISAATKDMKPEYQMYRRTKAVPAGPWIPVAP